MRLIDANDIPYVDLNGDMPTSGVHVWVAFKDRIDSMPTIGISAIEERKKGDWVRTSFYNDTHVCSECYSEGRWDWDYCPNCGTDMRGEQDE